MGVAKPWFSLADAQPLSALLLLYSLRGHNREFSWCTEGVKKHALATDIWRSQLECFVSLSHGTLTLLKKLRLWLRESKLAVPVVVVLPVRWRPDRPHAGEHGPCMHTV